MLTRPKTSNFHTVHNTINVTYLLSFLLSFSVIYPPPIVRLTLPGVTTQMPVRQIPVGGATDCGMEHYTDTQRRASLNVRSAQCQGHPRRQHRAEHTQNKGYTPSPRIEIKIPDSAGNRTRVGRESTDHAMADYSFLFVQNKNILNHFTYLPQKAPLL